MRGNSTTARHTRSGSHLGLVLTLTVLGIGAGGLISSASGAPAIAVTHPAKTFNPTGGQQVYTVPGHVTLVETDVNGADGGGDDVGIPLGGYAR